MLVVAALPLFVLLAAMFLVGVAGLGVLGVIAVIQAGRDQIEGKPKSPRLSEADLYEDHLTEDVVPVPTAHTGPSGQAAVPADGSDLRHTPRRLAQLEDQLGQALVRAEQQADHLRDRRRRIEGKEDRAELLARYDEDIVLLGRRGVNMRRVMALLWRTRAILELRAHLALTARQRPDLAHLPEGEVPKQSLETTAADYDNAADAVRSFVAHISERVADLTLAIPRIPDEADVDEDDRKMVTDEQSHTAETYASLQDRMDRLADTLSYLADRCRTRAVVAGSEVQFEAGAGTEGLLSEVTEALSGLQEMANLGDQQLADSALDNLAEDITQLERAGLDARAAAEAELEIARLLERVPA